MPATPERVLPPARRPEGPPGKSELHSAVEDPTWTITGIPCCLLASYPHDREAFTQGLALEGEALYESTGLYGQSDVRIVDLATGRVVRRTRLPDGCFGEGLAVVDDQVIQLTWRERTGLVYDRQELTLVDAFSYPTEGWGLTRHGGQLLMSDGSATLYALDLKTFKQEAVLQVTENGKPLVGLNDLQSVDGRLFANVYATERIVCIDLADGHVAGALQLPGLNDDPTLLTRSYLSRAAVLNGIAYDQAAGHLYVTGKLWDSVYKLDIGVARPPDPNPAIAPRDTGRSRHHE